MPRVKKGEAKEKADSCPDKRVTIKLDPELYRAVASLVGRHPEWGITSVSDFVRRAIDHELTARSMSADRKIIEIALSEASREDNLRRAP